MKINNLNSARKTVVLSLLLFVNVTSSAYEQSVKCRSVFEPDPFAYPYQSKIVVGESDNNRFVEFEMIWRESDLKSINGYGLELKTHQYNYDDAADVGKGPAYVSGPIGSIPRYCTLPGCYIDTDFLSETNSDGEYNEPQVAVGVWPESSRLISPGVTYSAKVDAVPGRGDKSLMKISYYTTKRIADIGVSGIFHCNDTYAKSVLKFQDMIWAPGCVYNKDIETGKC